MHVDTRRPPRMGIRHYSEARGLEIRADEGEVEGGGVRFGGYAVLWDDPAEIRDYFGSFTEQFRAGSFRKTLAERGPEGNGQIKFLRQHSAEMAIAARFLDLREDERGLRFEAETIDTTTGRDLAAELRAGVIDTVSIGFDAIREEWDEKSGVRTVLEARLFEISAVNWPAYANAKIDTVRAFEALPGYAEALLSGLREGKVLSAANFDRLLQARNLIDAVIQAAEPSDPAGPAEGPPAEDEDERMRRAIALHELEMVFRRA